MTPLSDAGTTPLAGMRVLDLSQQLPGPYCTLLLASLGADVTKVEPPSGDAARHLDPEMFDRVSPGKTSIRLDLKTEADQARVHDLLRTSDVVVEGFRPGVTERLGCGFETAAGLNPRIVYCSISGFGQSGPDAARPTHDLSLQAVVGALPPDATVDSVGVPWVDLGTATTAALLIASHWRAQEAVHLDLAMLDIASTWSRVKPSAVTRGEPSYGTFRAADGSLFALALLEDSMWSRLCSALALTAWSSEEGLGDYESRVARTAQVRARLECAIGKRDRDELITLAADHDLPLDEVVGLSRGDRQPQVAWRRQQAGSGGVLVPFGPGVGRPLPPAGH